MGAEMLLLLLPAVSSSSLLRSQLMMTVNGYIHCSIRASYRMSSLHGPCLHLGLTKTTSLHLVRPTDQQCMKLDSSPLYILPQNSVSKRRQATVQLSFTTNHIRPLLFFSFCVLGCCCQISHWELLKIHWLSGNDASTAKCLFLNLPYLLPAWMCHLSTIACTTADKYRANWIQKDWFLWTCLLSMQPWPL